MIKLIYKIIGSGRGESYTPPKPKLPPIPNKAYREVITLKYCKGFDWHNIEIIELDSYKKFFLFYMAHYDEGCIFDVEISKEESRCL